MTDCNHCDNPAEVCRGCYERARQEAYDWAGERLSLQYVVLTRQQALTASVAERLLLAEQERDRLRAQLARLREAARAIINVCPSHIARTDIIDDGAVYALTLGELRALAKALEETP